MRSGARLQFAQAAIFPCTARRDSPIAPSVLATRLSAKQRFVAIPGYTETMLMHGFDLQLAFGWPGGPEWIVLLVLGLLIFGKRLPDVGRSIGRGIVEFKRGIKGIEDDIDEESEQPARKPPRSENRELPEQDTESQPRQSAGQDQSEKAEEAVKK